MSNLNMCWDKLMSGWVVTIQILVTSFIQSPFFWFTLYNVYIFVNTKEHLLFILFAFYFFGSFFDDLIECLNRLLHK